MKFPVVACSVHGLAGAPRTVSSCAAGFRRIRADERALPGGNVSSILSRTAIATFAALATLAISTSAHAQAPVQSDAGASLVADSSVPSPAPALLSAPTIMALAAPAADASVAFRPAHQQIAPVVRRREAFSRPTVLMIVGGALIVTGLVVGGDASTIMYIAGAGIGGYGLYLHLQSPNARFAR